jgi:nitrogenase molybdenum-iron protein alpha/beta subunit
MCSDPYKPLSVAELWKPDPDSLTGAILAVEGIRDAAVLLNGPTGCKFYHGALVEDRLPRATSYDPMRYQDSFYFGQPRVPATYLDNDDYVFGSTRKLEEILPTVASRGHALLAIINSPGAALIGDDLERFVDQADLRVPVLTMESTAYSGKMSEGWAEAVIRMLQALAAPPPPAREDRKCVNLVGISIYDKFWEGDCTELVGLLAQLGVDVCSTLSAGDNVEHVRTCRQAALNIAVGDCGGERVAQWMEETWGIPFVAPPLPVGFDATDVWLRRISEALGVDPAPALRNLEEQRTRAIMGLKTFHGLTGYPKGLTFAVSANAATQQALSHWLASYLGMVPVEALGGAPAEADVHLADRFTLTHPHRHSEDQVQIEIALPSDRGTEMVPKCMLGGLGTLYLLEWILDGIDRKIHRRTLHRS